MPEIIIENLNVEYQPKRKKDYPVKVIEDMNVVFKTDTLNVILGYSGCGKTTLLKSILGLLDYDGKILLDGVDLNDLAIKDRNFAYVSQNYVLYPNMTVFDNIAFPLKLQGCMRDEIVERVNEVAEKLDLTLLLTRKPKHLSGGQQQRVALARAMVKKPTVYFFDEPLSNIDPRLRSEARLLIKKCIKEYQSTAIYVTHDFSEAMTLADYLYIINNGKIEISGEPLEVYNSNNETVNDLKMTGEEQ